MYAEEDLDFLNEMFTEGIAVLPASETKGFNQKKKKQIEQPR